MKQPKKPVKNVARRGNPADGGEMLGALAGGVGGGVLGCLWLFQATAQSVTTAVAVSAAGWTLIGLGLTCAALWMVLAKIRNENGNPSDKLTLALGLSRLSWLSLVVSAAVIIVVNLFPMTLIFHNTPIFLTVGVMLPYLKAGLCALLGATTGAIAGRFSDALTDRSPLPAASLA